ncbi:MAG: 30S ribosomal protein S13 [Patescibacteria group bacterium]|nr:30S ribosomal protein S13 [Patescibacteria group bacterium]
MARIAGVILPPNKRIEIGLTYIYGIGQSLARKILVEARVDVDKHVSLLTSEEEGRLRDIIEKKYKVEGDLRRIVATNIKRLKEIGSYRGSRHAKNLPARGQRTRTNSRTVRGNVRKTAGSGRRSASEKT